MQTPTSYYHGMHGGLDLIRSFSYERVYQDKYEKFTDIICGDPVKKNMFRVNDLEYYIDCYNYSYKMRLSTQGDVQFEVDKKYIFSFYDVNDYLITVVEPKSFSANFRDEYLAVGVTGVTGAKVSFDRIVYLNLEVGQLCR